MGGYIVPLAAVVMALTSLGVDGNPFSAGSDAGQRSSSCCMPRQFSAAMTLMESFGSATPTVLDMQMDFDRQLQAILNYTGSATPVNKLVTDFDKGMMYIVPTNYPNYCIKIRVPMPLVRCIPEDAEYLGGGYIGPAGAGQLSYDTFRITSSEPDMLSMVFTLTISRTSCVPLVEDISLPNGEYPSQTYVYSEYQAGLKDPSVFDLPHSCFN